MFSTAQATVPQPKVAAASREVVARVELKHPIPGHQGDIYALEFRQPVFGDWIECGDMHVTEVVDPRGMQRGDGGAARVTLKPEAVVMWMSRLSGLPIASLNRLELSDARAAYREMLRLVSSLDAGN